MPKYIALRIISFLIILVGSIAMILGLVGVLAVIGAHFAVVADVTVYSAMFVPIAVSMFFAGFFLITFGELIRVFVDIARNTAHLIPSTRQVRY